MSYKIYMILLVFGMINLVNADSINKQIEALKRANPQERVEMMNRIKTQIAKMNEQERFNTLQELQKNMNPQKGGFDPNMRNKNMNDKSAPMQHPGFKNRPPSRPKQQGNH